MRIIFKLVIHHGPGTSSGDRVFQRTLHLDFVPPIGMEFIIGDWSTKVRELIYQTDSTGGMVFAFADSLRPDGMKMRTDIEMDTLTRELEKEGWTRSKGLLSTNDLIAPL